MLSWIVWLTLLGCARSHYEYVSVDGGRYMNQLVTLRLGSKESVQSHRFPGKAPALLTQTWIVQAPAGRNIRLNCYTIGLPARQDGSCFGYTFTIKDGRDIQDLCGGIYGLSKRSNTDTLELTLKTGGQDAGLIDCSAEILGDTSATPAPVVPGTTPRPQWPNMPPYVNQPSEEIDSSEHGGAPGPSPTTCPCGYANKQAPRIVGGVAARVNEFPFAVMLILKGGYGPFCGGSIISPRHVLTAAHCVIKYTTYGISIVAGDHDYTTENETPSRTVIDVSRVIMHERYPGESHYDIALLVLEREIQYNKHIGPVCIPHKRLDLSGKYLKALGWGRVSPYGSGSPYLKKANVRVVDFSVCKDYAGVEYSDPHQICTFSKMKGLGKGDSGGPVVWLNERTNRYTLVGLPSFVYFYNDTNTLPDVSTDVSTLLPWIHEKMRATQPQAQACWAA